MGEVSYNSVNGIYILYVNRKFCYPFLCLFLIVVSSIYVVCMLCLNVVLCVLIFIFPTDMRKFTRGFYLRVKEVTLHTI